MPLIVSNVSSEPQLTEIYRLRYKVFCGEWGYEKHANHIDGIVSDSYDKDSIHFAVKDMDVNKIYGAIMMILNPADGFPVENCCELDINIDELPRDGLAEISRMVIHRDFRRRAEDKYIYGNDEERRSIGSFNYQSNYGRQRTLFRRSEDKTRSKSRRAGDQVSDQRRRHEIVVNLYKALYQESKLRQITHWYALFTKGIVGLLNRFGLRFEPIGDPVDYHGIRTPYLGEIKNIEQTMSEVNPGLYEEFTRDL